MQKVFNHKVTQLTIGLIAFTFLITSMPNGNFYIEYLQKSLEQATATKAQPLEVEETVYAVKLGKVFVTPDLRLYGHHSAAQFKDIENAKQIKDEVGGTLYKSVLMPVEGDSDAKGI